MANLKTRLLKLESRFNEQVNFEYVIVKRIIEFDGTISGAIYKPSEGKSVNLSNEELKSLMAENE